MTANTMLDVDQYLAQFRATHSLPDLLGWLDRCATLRPLVLGEAILDRYDFVEVIGKSTKDPTLATLYKSTEMYAGGSLAIANHLAGLCDNPNSMNNSASVRLITRLGEAHRHEDFILANLSPSVLADFTTQRSAPTICKRRIVDRYSGTKLLETYLMDDSADSDPAQLVARIDTALSECDLILACDFGHGFFSDRTIRRLWASRKFLAVNCQANAGNRGYNTISKWRRADYVSLANHEVDLECRQQDGDDREKLLEITKKLSASKFTVTRGKWGTLHYDVVDETFYEAPALASKVVDRVGAGDAVFAVTSLLVKLGAPWEIVAFIGNVAGAVAVECLGNKQAIDRARLEEHIRELLNGKST